jgi:hypothetical protein
MFILKKKRMESKAGINAHFIILKSRIAHGGCLPFVSAVGWTRPLMQRRCHTAAAAAPFRIRRLLLLLLLLLLQQQHLCLVKKESGFDTTTVAAAALVVVVPM